MPDTAKIAALAGRVEARLPDFLERAPSLPDELCYEVQPSNLKAVCLALRDDPDLVADVQAAVDDANQAVSRAESIRKFRILDVDFTQEAGQLTVKLGIRRSVLLKDFAADIDALYS